MSKACNHRLRLYLLLSVIIVSTTSCCYALDNIVHHHLNQKEDTSTFASKLNSTQLYTLIPNRYPNATSLPPIVAQIPKSPEGKRAIEEIVEYLHQRLGVTVNPGFIEEALEDPSILLNLLVYSVLELYEGVNTLNLLHQKGYLNETARWPPERLPHGFELSDILQSPINLTHFWPPPPKNITSFLWKGFFKGDFTDEEALSTVTMGLALYQLSENHRFNRTKDEYFVFYEGKRYVDAYVLLEDLVSKHDYSISSFTDCRTANFLPLWTQSENGDWLEVPAPIMIRTGVMNSSGDEAVIPAVHCELIVALQGEHINTTFNFFESTQGVGFFPTNLQKITSWVGKSTSSVFSSEDTLKMLQLAPYYQAINSDSIKEYDLYENGYGTTGVCVTAVAVLLQQLSSDVMYYPHIIDLNFILPVIAQAVKMNGFEADAIYITLQTYLKNLPVDYVPSSSLIARALEMIIWPPGQEPFFSVEIAREILLQQSS